MRRNASCSLALFLAVMLLANAGCRSGGIPLLNLVPIGKPVVVALVTDTPLESGHALMAYEPMRAALGKALDRNVYTELCLPLQGEPCLKSGMYQVAVVSPVHYARFSAAEPLPALAVPADAKGRVARPALLVVAKDSDIQKPEDLRGKKVAFGPSSDARTHEAGLELLRRSGLAKTDLALELFPVPGSLRHFPNMRSIAQSVMSGGYDAGFIDEQAWEAFPEDDEREGEPARDKLRVIARTVAVPDRLVVCSPKLSQADGEKIRRFLLAAAQEHPQILHPLRLSGYQEPPGELLDTCRRLVKPEQTAESPQE
jgi:ABC-type phosphate/phosphonate transport system substrate-binding protein